MKDMLDTDTAIFDPIALFCARLDHKLPTGEKLREKCSKQVIADASDWVKDFEPAARKAERQREAQREIDKLEDVLDETHLLALELSLYIQAATVRHPELRDDLKPRVGTTVDEYVQNLCDMRDRLTDKAEELKERKIVVKLDPAHTPAAVKDQAEKHRAAKAAIDRLEKASDNEQQHLNRLRKLGAKLQSRINLQLSAAIEGDRPTQVDFGYTERATTRPAKKAEKKATDVGAASPPAPGPVASGTAGGITPGTETGNPATPGAPALSRGAETTER